MSERPNVNEPALDEPREREGFRSRRARHPYHWHYVEEELILALSTNGEPDIVMYPDSGKVGAFERLPDGGGLDKLFPLAADVDYYEGEAPPALD